MRFGKDCKTVFILAILSSGEASSTKINSTPSSIVCENRERAHFSTCCATLYTGTITEIKLSDINYLPLMCLPFNNRTL